MFDFDLMMTFAIMTLLFLRQIAIFRQPGKINYAPILLGIGAIGAMSHLLLHPEYNDWALLLRESLLPLFFGLLLFIIMNVMHQTVLRDENQRRIQELERFTSEVEHIKKNIEASDVRLQSLSSTEHEIKQTLDRFSNIDFTSLKSIEENQHTFFSKFETIFEQQQTVLKSFETFTDEKLPDIDSVIHRHIDMLRIAEQDHYNHLKKAINVLLDENEALKNAFANIKVQVPPQPLISDEKLKAVVLKIDNLMQQVVHDFERQMISLRAQSESLSTSISESDSLMESIRKQEEVLMGELVLSSKHIKQMHDDSQKTGATLEPIVEMLDRVKAVQHDYLQAKERLDMLVDALQNVEAFQFEKMRDHIETLSVNLTEKIEESLENLHKHYNIAHQDISKTVQELSTRARFAKSYKNDDQS
jgi:DNA repair exonuclease SbcCD ATPase subunit